MPTQIVYESLLATEGDAAVRHGCARRSRQRALHRFACIVPPAGRAAASFKQRSPMSHRDTHGERRCRRGDARGVRSPPPRRQGGRGAADPNELDRLRAEVAVKERAARDARSAEEVATQKLEQARRYLDAERTHRVQAERELETARSRLQDADRLHRGRDRARACAEWFKRRRSGVCGSFGGSPLALQTPRCRARRPSTRAGRR